MLMYSLGTSGTKQLLHFMFKSDSLNVQPDIISSSYRNVLQLSQLFLIKKIKLIIINLKKKIFLLVTTRHLDINQNIL